MKRLNKLFFMFLSVLVLLGVTACTPTVETKITQILKNKSQLPMPSIKPLGTSLKVNQRIEIVHPANDVFLYYTTDGSEPNELSMSYIGPFTVPPTVEEVLIRAKAFKKGFLPSLTAEKKYTLQKSVYLTNLQVFANGENKALTPNFDKNIDSYSLNVENSISGIEIPLY